jgi:hypothetical protein
MRRLSVSGLVLILAMPACSSDDPTDPLTRSYAMQETPFEARCQLAIQPAQPISPGVVRQLDVGECIASHLGKSTLVSDKIIDFAAGTQTTTVTFTAANGDALRGTGTGRNALVAPGRVAFTAQLTFTGGTGRFADASGSAVIVGEADLVNARSALTMSGAIKY